MPKAAVNFHVSKETGGFQWFKEGEDVPQEIADKISNPACLVETAGSVVEEDEDGGGLGFDGYDPAWGEKELMEWVIEPMSQSETVTRAEYALDYENSDAGKGRSGVLSSLDKVLKD